MKETVREIESIRTRAQLANFMASHEPRKYSPPILKALHTKYDALTKGRPSARMQALYASMNASYANFHPVWSTQKPRRTRLR